MGLLDQVREEQQEANRNEAFTPDRTDRVAYLLDRSYDGTFEDEDYEFDIDEMEVRDKRDIESSMPLFYMTRQETVKEGRKIVRQMDNPYIDHCTSLEEVALSEHLYRLDHGSNVPTHIDLEEMADEDEGLNEAYLEQHHFRTLLDYLHAQHELEETEDELEELEDENEDRGEGVTGIFENIADSLSVSDYQKQRKELTERKERLEDFIEQVDDHVDEQQDRPADDYDELRSHTEEPDPQDETAETATLDEDDGPEIAIEDGDLP